MNASLDQVLECVHGAVLQLSYRWKIYCQLFDSGAENIALLNSSGGNLFELFQRLVLDDAILALARLTDPASSGKTRENASIKLLVSTAKPVLPPDVVAECEAALTRLDAHVLNLRVHRDKALAHTDLEHSLHVHLLPQITYDELEAAMNESRAILNVVRLALFHQTCSYDVIVPFGRSGTDLLSLLKRAHGSSNDAAGDEG
jgi:hypothetical protein